MGNIRKSAEVINEARFNRYTNTQKLRFIQLEDKAVNLGYKDLMEYAQSMNGGNVGDRTAADIIHAAVLQNDSIDRIFEMQAW